MLFDFINFYLLLYSKKAVLFILLFIYDLFLLRVYLALELNFDLIAFSFRLCGFVIFCLALGIIGISATDADIIRSFFFLCTYWLFAPAKELSSKF
jgi:hypothetical protein